MQRSFGLWPLQQTLRGLCKEWPLLRPQRGHEAVRRVVDLLRLHQEQRKNFGRTRQHVLHSIEALERRLARELHEREGGHLRQPLHDRSCRCRICLGCQGTSVWLPIAGPDLTLQIAASLPNFSSNRRPARNFSAKRTALTTIPRQPTCQTYPPTMPCRATTTSSSVTWTHLQRMSASNSPGTELTNFAARSSRPRTSSTAKRIASNPPTSSTSSRAGTKILTNRISERSFSLWTSTAPRSRGRWASSSTRWPGFRFSASSKRISSPTKSSSVSWSLEFPFLVYHWWRSENFERSTSCSNRWPRKISLTEFFHFLTIHAVFIFLLTNTLSTSSPSSTFKCFSGIKR